MSKRNYHSKKSSVKMGKYQPEPALRTHSQLNSPVRYWSEDLPDPAKEQREPPQLIRVNEINDIWMEIPRYDNIIWVGMWFVLIILLIPLYIIFQSINESGVTYDMLFNGLSFIGISCFVFHFKMVLFVPRGAPVRFNRKRQKVYAYEYQRSIWPWKRWRAEIKAFDWADIHGERVHMVGHADWGHRVYCAVCKPGTFEVVDRFILTWTVGSIYEAYGLWSHCCQYMQGKPVPTEPLLTNVPPSWTPFNTIHWPKEIDKESTTAPDA